MRYNRNDKSPIETELEQRVHLQVLIDEPRRAGRLMVDVTACTTSREDMYSTRLRAPCMVQMWALTGDSSGTTKTQHIQLNAPRLNHTNYSATGM